MSTAKTRKEKAESEDANILAVDGKPTGNKRLSSEEALQKEREGHTRRMSWFVAEAARQASNRSLMARCEAAYDSEQWNKADAEAVRQRGQNPVVYNEIKPVIDWLIGTDRRSRVDFLVIAEEDGEDAEDDARTKTKTLKYLDAVNRADFERSYAAEDAFKAGMGWIEVGIRGDKSGSLVYIGHDSWRNHLHDSQAQKRDLTDGRYHFRVKVVDLDIALACFPDKEVEIRRCVQSGDQLQAFSSWLGGSGIISGLDHFSGQWRPDDYNTVRPVDIFNPRERVMLIECWSREPVRRKLEGGLGDPVTFEIHCSIMTESDTLVSGRSPFKHDRFPFIPVWGYKNRRTGLPYPPIFPLLGPQEALNHRMSRSLWEASKNQKEIEAGAIDDEVMDIDELRAELDDPNGIAIYANGALSGSRVRDRDDMGAAQKHLVLADRDIMHMRQSSGVTGENRGLDTNATSGKAVIAKAEQGGLLTAELFDNLLLARQLEGEMTLSVSEQFMVEPRTIRVPGEKWERVKINDEQADGSFRNDITARRAHFVVGEQAWKQSYAESAFDSLMLVFTQLAPAAPNIVIAMLDVLFEMHPNLPRKQQILQRIRSVNGQTDPDGKMTPEQQQAAKMQQMKAQAQFEAEMATLKATVKEAEAKGEKLSAEGMAKRLETIYMAAQAAQVAVQIPGAMPVADQLLKSAGFQDQDGGQAATVPQQVQHPQMQQIPPAQQADGALAGHEAGIQTVAPDGVTQPQGVM
ncbi:MAG: hypothetical protein IV107_16380 [Paucibacter sp.]|nr:hypothetical protein [Roseateles sp.]